jgi:hypothetical protein
VRYLSATDVGNAGVHSLVELATNDYLEVYVDISGGASPTITAEFLTMTVTEAD